MKKTIFATALALTSYGMAADVSLTGKVVDEGAAAVAGVAVVLPGIADTAWTDASGNFTLTGVQSSAIRSGTVANLGLRRSGRRVSLTGTQAGVSYTLDAFLPNGRALVRNLAFQDGQAQLPPGAYQSLFLQVRSGGALVAGWSGVTVTASRATALAGVLNISKAGYLSDTLGLASLTGTGLSKTLLLSNPWIPAGDIVRSGTQIKILASGKSFAMGSDMEAPDFTFNPEGARHSVKFTRDFWMDTTEVTQKLYDSVMTAAYGGEYVKPIWVAEYGLGDSYPAYYIQTSGGAILFANARSKQAGLDSVYSYTSRDAVGGSTGLVGVVADLNKNGYRLPTEAEWEYAARAGTVTDYSWGSDTSSATLDKYAVWAGNSFSLGIGAAGFGSHPVATKLPNAYGLYDMQGNVSEWTGDLTDFGTYPAAVAIDPTGSTSGDGVIRGGNWGGTGINLRSSSRTFYAPAYDYNFKGVRTVRTVK